MTTPSLDSVRLHQLMLALPDLDCHRVALSLEKWECSGQPWPPNIRDLVKHFRAESREAALFEDPAPAVRTSSTADEKRRATRSRIQLESIQELVLFYRRYTFGGDGAPFDTLSDAADYIAKWDGGFRIDRRRRHLPYYLGSAKNGDEWPVGQIRANRESALFIFALERLVTRLHAATGIPKASLVAHFLVRDAWPGVRIGRGRHAPVLPNVPIAIVRPRVSALLPTRRFTVEMELDDLGVRPFQRILSQVQADRLRPGLFPTQALAPVRTRSDGVLLLIVATHGGPPLSKWSRSFWGEVRDEYKLRTGEAPADWIAVARRYYRIVDDVRDHCGLNDR